MGTQRESALRHNENHKQNHQLTDDSGGPARITDGRLSSLCESPLTRCPISGNSRAAGLLGIGQFAQFFPKTPATTREHWEGAGKACSQAVPLPGEAGR